MEETVCQTGWMSDSLVKFLARCTHPTVSLTTNTIVNHDISFPPNVKENKLLVVDTSGLEKALDYGV